MLLLLKSCIITNILQQYCLIMSLYIPLQILINFHLGDKMLKIGREIRDKLITESMQDWIWELDVKSGDAITSDFFKRSLGFEPWEVTDNISFWNTLIHHDNFDEYQKVIKPSKNINNNTFETEFRIKTKSGDFKWLFARGNAYRDENGNIIYLSGFFMDTTPYKRAEESEKKFRNLVEMSPHGVFTHTDGIITYANQRSMRMLRVDSIDEIIGTSVNEHLVDFYKDIASKRRSLLHSGHSILPMEMEIIRKDGSKLYGEVSSISIPGEADFNCLSYVKDITEHKLILEQNKKLLDQTLEYDRLKTEFFSNVSHELRTPLNIILSSVQLLNIFYTNKDVDLNKFFNAYEKYIAGIQQNSYRLLKLINNLIDLTKMDSGFFKMDYTNLNIVEMVEDIAQSVSPYIESKGISFLFDTDVEEKIQAVDVLKLERIVLNLLSNAVKFTPPGGTIEVTVADKEECTIISIKDTGCGIPEDKLDVIFERFRQVDSLLTRRAEGSGIGLSLVKALVEAHDGSITVKSAPELGSEFTVELPVKLAKSTSVDSTFNKIKSDSQSKIERISIEFSDIYE
jgi:PAS domain S-box-containing protein